MQVLRLSAAMVALLAIVMTPNPATAQNAIAPTSPEYGRALKGRVVGPDGLPIPAAVVRCAHVRTPGEGLISVGAGGSVSTDDKGNFVLYPIDPATGPRGPRFDFNDPPKPRERGDLIPLNSRFGIEVEVPGDSSYFPLFADPTNNDFVVLRLQRPAKARTFKYEAAGGGFQDDRKLEPLLLYYARDARSERHRLPERYRTGGHVAPGIYMAQLDRIEFRPITITADSPDELVFKLPPPVTYTGRAIDGATGKPLAGVFVIAMNGTGQYGLSRLEAEHWQKLAALPTNPRKDDPALTPVREMYTFELVTRTDDQGRFELVQPPEMGQTYGLVFFAKDRLPLVHRLYDNKPDADGRATIADVPMFPAARVVLRPKWTAPAIGSASPPPAVMPVWEPAADAKIQPAWFAAFKSAADGGQRQFAHDAYLQVNQKQPIFVPAGVTLTLRLETPYHTLSSPRDIPDVLKLDAGASQALGDVEFEPNLKTKIRVADPAGTPVEGVPIRWIDERYGVWSVVHNTDGKGEAEFYVRPRCVGRFGVIDLPGMNQGNLPPNLVIPFRAGEKELEHPLPMQITRPQIELLRGPKPAAL